jgi:U3 small nucleolar RNA-associated protein 6
MSGPSDKARFYLEQAVPQLQEFKEKKIFSEVRFVQDLYRKLQ